MAKKKTTQKKTATKKSAPASQADSGAQGATKKTAAKKKTATKKTAAKKKTATKKTAAKKKTATKKTATKKTAAKKTAAKKTAAKKTGGAKAAPEETPQKSSSGSQAASRAKAASGVGARSAASAEPPEPQGGSGIGQPSAPEATAKTASGASKRTSGKRARPKLDPELEAVLSVTLPESSSERAAASASASVWAISSEKTQDVRLAIRERDAAAEDEAREEWVEVAPGSAAVSVDAALRRCTRDPFGFFREELARPELDPIDLLSGWRHKNQRLRHELLPGLSVDALREAEREIGHALPPSWWDFSLEWSGGRLFTRPEGGFRLLSPAEILREAEDRLGGLMRLPYLPIVDLGAADYLCLDLSKPSKTGEFAIHWWHCGTAQRRVSESFSRWLKQLVESGGEPFWWATATR